MTSSSPTGLGNAVLAVCTIFLIFAIVAVLLRAVVIFHTQRRRVKAHDIAVSIGLIIAIGQVVVVYLEVYQGGLGKHETEVSAEALTLLLKLVVADNFIWLFATTAVKLSVLFLYLDLFGVRVQFKRAVWGFIGFICCFFVGFLISIVLLCNPFSHYWDTTGPGSCGSLSDSETSTAAINTVVDLSIVILPMPTIWTLHLSPKKKAAISAILGVGFLIFLINLSRLIEAIITGQEDFTYYLAPQSILTCLEVQVGIINSCLPTLKPLFRRKGDNVSNFQMGPTTAGVPHSTTVQGSKRALLGRRNFESLDEAQLIERSAGTSSTAASASVSERPNGAQFDERHIAIQTDFGVYQKASTDFSSQ